MCVYIHTYSFLSYFTPKCISVWGGERNDSAFKSTDCSNKGPEFSCSRPSRTVVPWTLKPFSVVQVYMQIKYIIF